MEDIEANPTQILEPKRSNETLTLAPIVGAALVAAPAQNDEFPQAQLIPGPWCLIRERHRYFIKIPYLVNPLILKILIQMTLNPNCNIGARIRAIRSIRRIRDSDNTDVTPLHTPLSTGKHLRIRLIVLRIHAIVMT